MRLYKFKAILLFLTGCSQSHLVVMSLNDKVTTPDDTVLIQAKLQQKNLFLGDVKNAPILFRMISSPDDSCKEWKSIKKTNRDGRAGAFVPVRKEGLYEIEISYEGDHRLQPRADIATILAITKHKPILVLDVDGTLTQSNWMKSEDDQLPYDADTVAVVNELSQRYAIVYLTARPMMLHSRTRLWLEKYHFPKGPILLWYPKRAKWLSFEEYKEDILEKLDDAGLNLAAGVGNSEGDIDAYKDAGMKAIWLRKPHEKHDDDEDDAIVVRSWSAIRDVLSK